MKRFILVTLVLFFSAASLFSADVYGQKYAMSRYIKGDSTDPLIPKVAFGKAETARTEKKPPRYIYIEYWSSDPMVAKLMKVENKEKKSIDVPKKDKGEDKNEQEKRPTLKGLAIAALDKYDEKKYGEALAKCRLGLEIASGIEQGRLTSELSPKSIAKCKEELFDIFSKAEYAILQNKAKIAFNNLGIKLSGILWQEERPAAIINSSLVRKNDTVRGVRVSLIFESSVKVAFTYEGRIFYYTLTL